MKFYLTKLVDGNQKFLEISKSDYAQIESSRSNLFQALYIEEKLDLLIENYVEYEIELLSSSAHHMLFQDKDWSVFTRDINKISRRIINLLSSARLYTDQIVHHLSTIYRTGDEKVKIVRQQMSIEYDNNLSYRIMDSLRNYVQHRGFPISGCTYNSKTIEEDPVDEPSLLYAVTPYLKLDQIRRDNKFKKSVANEMIELGDKIDIKPLVRGFIVSIGNIHDKVRETIKNDVISWENFLYEIVQKFNTQYGLRKKDLSIDAVVYDENQRQKESIYIFNDFIDQRKELERKNRWYNRLPFRFITSQSLKSNA